MIDALVIGGGFYGVSIAAYLVQHFGLGSVRLIEREPELLARASYHNQARIHNGYHYPRSFVTAYRSRINLPRFVADFPFAVKKDFTKLYAIARHNSKINARQFQRFCKEIGARLDSASQEHSEIFERRLIEAVFEVEEFAFDAGLLRSWAAEQLGEDNVELSMGDEAKAFRRVKGGIEVVVGKTNEDGRQENMRARYVFNCTYSALNHFGGDLSVVSTPLKHEVAEMGLVRMPAKLKDIGVTVMDGPFFSVMPFPARELHSLSHVRYTPHLSWTDEVGRQPYKILEDYKKESRVSRMFRDARRYMPVLADAQQLDSLFEVKTVLEKNEGNDGRPILFEKHIEMPGFYSILGGKIDNIYDVLEKLSSEDIRRA